MSQPAIQLATRTTTQLLRALHEARNEPVWEQVDARFRPVVAGLARRLGLSDSDAEEVAQQTLTEFVTAYRAGRYHREQGRLSSWILGIAHNLCRQAMRSRARRNAASLSGDAGDDLAENPESLRSLWAEQRDRVILSRAMDLLRAESAIDPRTLRAFELVGIRGVPTAEAAAQCGMTPDEVYVAKSRVSRRLRALVAEMTEAFEEDQ